MTKEQVISKVNESAGSLFTKEDVIRLIESIEGTTAIDFEELANRLEHGARRLASLWCLLIVLAYFFG